VRFGERFQVACFPVVAADIEVLVIGIAKDLFLEIKGPAMFAAIIHVA
jgi:hypothetical protein